MKVVRLVILLCLSPILVVLVILYFGDDNSGGSPYDKAAMQFQNIRDCTGADTVPKSFNFSFWNNNAQARVCLEKIARELGPHKTVALMVSNNMKVSHREDSLLGNMVSGSYDLRENAPLYPPLWNIRNWSKRLFAWQTGFTVIFGGGGSVKSVQVVDSVQ